MGRILKRTKKLEINVNVMNYSHRQNSQCKIYKIIIPNFNELLEIVIIWQKV